jgi:ribosomal RNA assembly protein
MQYILLPIKRVKILLDKEALKEIESKLNCSIRIMNENEIEIEGEPYAEYNAKNVISAFGRGFDMQTALKLLSEDYFFSIINLKDIFKNKDQIHRIKSRVIGKEGKSKNYIEEVSGAIISIYGNTISFIGTTDELKIASTAINILIEGGTHKKAYRSMEDLKRKLNETKIHGI